MASRFAEKTKVPATQTRNEIEATLTKYGAAQFAYMNDSETGASTIMFLANARKIKFVLPMPERGSMREDAWGQIQRQRWRALLLAIKAKLEAVECGISEFESEFLANIVNPCTGFTVAEEMRPLIASNYQGKPQQLLLGKS